ncbi:hypothetical protein M427DRAFT_52001 [Gonapodya prolifera JEL478]|uniref:Uncharacterized protein n=1 Tax=Gonapodya prolifera (strain JEL478) TaxID=1344416 RepID=A0A139AUH7_GONPJ|nr:hypothetical protein M427DRAFT_52001 [Gonapodya prolifera JEL478]|eukprot:KXS20359.1 hypothetical protein M427DRAFT_52001 [Gonapodya prolifera JEL478]
MSQRFPRPILVAVLGHGFLLFLLVIVSSSIVDQAQPKDDRSACTLWARQLYTADQITMPNSSAIPQNATNVTLPFMDPVPTVNGARAIAVLIGTNSYYIQGLPWSCQLGTFGSVAAMAVSVSLFLAIMWHILRENNLPRWWRIVSTSATILASILLFLISSVLTGGVYTTCKTLGASSLDPNAVREQCTKVYPGALLTILVGAGCAWIAAVSWSIYGFIQYRQLGVATADFESAPKRESPKSAQEETATTKAAAALTAVEMKDTNPKSMWGSGSGEQGHSSGSPQAATPSSPPTSTTKSSTNPFEAIAANPFSSPYDRAPAGGDASSNPWSTTAGERREEGKGRTSGGYAV